MLFDNDFFKRTSKLYTYTLYKFSIVWAKHEDFDKSSDIEEVIKKINTLFFHQRKKTDFIETCSF